MNYWIRNGFWQIRTKSYKKLMKALAISVGFVIFFLFTLTMFEWTLLLDFSIISCGITFHIKVVLLQFLSKIILKYSYLDLRIEKVTLLLNILNFSWINYFLRVSFFQAQYFRNNLSLFHIRCLISLFIYGSASKVLSFLVTLVNSVWWSTISLRVL